MSSKQSTSFAKVAEPFACGGAAASFASIIIHPIDLAKVSQLLLRGSTLWELYLCRDCKLIRY